VIRQLNESGDERECYEANRPQGKGTCARGCFACVGVRRGMSKRRRRGGMVRRGRQIDFRAMSDTGCQTICDRLWTKESDKPEAERNWPRILKLLTRIEELGREWNSEILWACAIRAKVVVHSDYLAELEVGARLVQAAQFEKSLSRDVSFLLCECIGRQYRYAKNWASAKQWLDQALESDSASFALLRQRALLELGIAEERINREAAVKACDRAVALARSSKSLSDLRLIEALGEKAIACWNAGDRKAAFACWEEGAAKILDWPKRDDGWKSLVGMFGHASGYFSALFSGLGKPAPEYVVPEPGWFLRDRERVSEVYAPKKEWVLAGHISMMAEAIDQSEKASEWALRALDKRFGIYRQNLVPFLIDFWMRSVETESYAYKQPSMLKKKLAEIAQGDGERKEKAMLVELDWSLATKPNAEMQL
jgi:tetratricopeptide (TPR) repeat protein